MVQTTTWAMPYRVPDTLHSDTEESVVGTQWHQNSISALSDMLEEVARRESDGAHELRAPKTSKESRWYRPVDRTYTAMLRFSMAHRWVVVIA